MVKEYLKENCAIQYIRGFYLCMKEKAGSGTGLGRIRKSKRAYGKC